jgi:catechol 2,3-dioxygenase-like lactoylglutathione lyase family enzyme
MLGSQKIVAFVPTTDSVRARAFYEGVLGLRFLKDDGFAMVLDANGIMVRVAKVPEFKPMQFTILGWQVSGIEKVVRELQEKGVHFEIFGNLDRADGGQGRVVQGSGWEYFVSVRARVGNFVIGQFRNRVISACRAAPDTCATSNKILLWKRGQPRAAVPT